MLANQSKEIPRQVCCGSSFLEHSIGATPQDKLEYLSVSRKFHILIMTKGILKGEQGRLFFVKCFHFHLKWQQEIGRQKANFNFRAKRTCQVAMQLPYVTRGCLEEQL